MKLRIVLVAVAVAAMLYGCAPATQKTAVDEETLDLAVDVIDEADAFVAGVQAGWPDYAIEDQIQAVDINLNWFVKAGGDKTMPAFYEAITSWREGLGEIGSTESSYLEERNIEDVEQSLEDAKSELDKALDAAGE